MISRACGNPVTDSFSFLYLPTKYYVVRCFELVLVFMFSFRNNNNYVCKLACYFVRPTCQPFYILKTTCHFLNSIQSALFANSDKIG